VPERVFVMTFGSSYHRPKPTLVIVCVPALLALLVCA